MQPQKNLHPENIYAYLDWLRTRGQIWPPTSQLRQGAPATDKSITEIAQAADSEPSADQNAKLRCVFVSKEAWTDPCQKMRANLVRALHLNDSEFIWLDLARDVNGQKRRQLDQLKADCSYLLIFGSELVQLLESPRLDDNELPLQRQNPSHEVLLLPSLASMQQEPKRKLAVWQLLQRTVLRSCLESP